MNIGVTIYDGKSDETSKYGAHVKRSVPLPNAPFIGMILITEHDWWRVKEVRWQCADKTFFLVLEDKFQLLDIEGVGHSSFLDWLDALKNSGWSVSKPFPASG